MHVAEGPAVMMAGDERDLRALAKGMTAGAPHGDDILRSWRFRARVKVWVTTMTTG